jgi:hypothetical protein
MSKTRILLAAICLLLFLSAALALTLRSRVQTPPQAAFTMDIERPVNELIAGYKQWTRVNPEPLLMAVPSAQLCAALTPTAVPAGPHAKDKFITVYVNDTGRHAMMEEQTPHFPQGSVVIKEKLTTANSKTPELLTVMIKREPGYNPESGDWEFMVVDGSGKTVQARGKLENCQSCHQHDQDTDYVSRSYLPMDVRTRLK